MWNVDPLLDPRLVNIPSPEPDPKPDSNKQKWFLNDTPLKYYAWEMLGSIAAWGHVPNDLIPDVCPRVPQKSIEEVVVGLWECGALRRYLDCPTCEGLEIWSLRQSHFLQKIVASSPLNFQIGFFGCDPEGRNTTNYVPPEKLVKHDVAAVSVAVRLSKMLPAGWILGARDARWSTLLRFPSPKIGATAFRDSSRTGQIERWADWVYVSEAGDNRVAVEVTVSQSAGQLARKARWWGVSIAQRGGAAQSGLRVVLLNPPKKDIAGVGIMKAFPQHSGRDSGWRRDALEGVLSASWEDWMSAPASGGGWLAWQHETVSKKKSVPLGSGLDTWGWNVGVQWANDNRLLKGAVRCGS